MTRYRIEKKNVDIAAQLPLQLELPDAATLDGFVGATNATARAAVTDLIGNPGGRLFLHGPGASGKTHLLQAACRAVGEDGKRAVYVPLAQLGADSAGLLAGLDTLDCACLDDIGTIAGHAETELAVIGLIDALQARHATVFFADRMPPGSLALVYPDLASRLGSGGALALAEPNDEDKIVLLQTRADWRGLDLPGTTAQWLLRHGNRGVGDLIERLDQLDRAALAAQRRLTIPFVKQILGGLD